MSMRRSSRARIPQLPSTVPVAPSTSASSETSTSTRTDRAMPRQSNHKQSSPQKSSTPHSLSSEEPQPAPPLTRRRTREQDPDDEHTKIEDTLEDEDDEQEVTRCVCTFLEYPGPPLIAHKSKEGPTSSLTDSDVQNDEGGLFIQCDTCKRTPRDKALLVPVPFSSTAARTAVESEPHDMGVTTLGAVCQDLANLSLQAMCGSTANAWESWTKPLHPTSTSARSVGRTFTSS